MNDPQSQMQQRACVDAIWSYQEILVETIRRMLETIKMLPEGEIQNRLLKDISTLDVTADAIMWAMQMMDPEKPTS